MKALTARIGPSKKGRADEYGRYLELGTKRGLAPRPWLRRALDESRTQINTLLASLNLP